MPSSAIRIGLALLFVAAMLYATFGMGGVDCEVCLEFRGQEACRTVTAPSRDQAIQQAISTACSHVSSGVTDSMECSRTPPQSLQCTE